MNTNTSVTPVSIESKVSVQPWRYYIVRDEQDTPIQLVRVGTSSNLIVVGKGSRVGEHRPSQFFTKKHKPNLDLPLSFELIDACESGHPLVQAALDSIRNAVKQVVKHPKRYGAYGITDAREKAFELMANGATRYEAAKLCKIPISSLYRWVKEATKRVLPI
jgi:hypothetical protein